MNCFFEKPGFSQNVRQKREEINNPVSKLGIKTELYYWYICPLNIWKLQNYS